MREYQSTRRRGFEKCATLAKFYYFDIDIIL